MDDVAFADRTFFGLAPVAVFVLRRRLLVTLPNRVRAGIAALATGVPAHLYWRRSRGPAETGG